ncbi:adenylate/guanylate cyclase domain-containing protein [Actinomadura keratinilytica]
MTRTEVTYPLIELLLPELEEFLVYVWRRQLAASTGRVIQVADDEEMVDRRFAVAFADLVGFTRLTRRMEEEELGELVEAFETTAADLVAARGGRLVKTLGDEVLFAADDAGTAAEIALLLIETMANDGSMPELRVGMTFGTITTRMGDVFGTTVNLASRLTSIAPKNAILVDSAFAAELVRTGEARPPRRRRRPRRSPPSTGSPSSRCTSGRYGGSGRSSPGCSPAGTDFPRRRLPGCRLFLPRPGRDALGPRRVLFGRGGRGVASSAGRAVVSCPVGFGGAGSWWPQASAGLEWACGGLDRIG